MNRVIAVPAVDQAFALATQCVQLRCLGVLCGAPGVGKTVALRNVQERFSSLGLPGACFYYRAFPTEGSGRGIKDLLDGLGVRGSMIPMGASLQLVNKIAQREFLAQNIRLLLIDEADAWSTEALRGFTAVVDATRDTAQPVGALLAGSAELPKMISQHGATFSRTLRVDVVDTLSTEIALAVLRQWGEPFERLTIEIKGGDRDARSLAKRIFQGTGGNLRRLSYFARLYLTSYPQDDCTSKSVEHVFAQMLRGDKTC